MRKILKLVSLIVLVAISVTSCKKDKVENNETEVITTMELHFQEKGTMNQAVFKFNDPDGPGGSVPVKDLITLAPNKSYDMRIILLDKTRNPVDSISVEVEKEADNHRFYFIPGLNSNITVTNPDNDNLGLPLGLKSVVTTGAATPGGKLRIVLRHYENGGKAASDPVDSNKSTTDIDQEFDTKIQ